MGGGTVLSLAGLTRKREAPTPHKARRQNDADKNRTPKAPPFLSSSAGGSRHKVYFDHVCRLDRVMRHIQQAQPCVDCGTRQVSHMNPWTHGCLVKSVADEFRRWSGGDWRIGCATKAQETRGIGQSAGLERPARMLRAERRLRQAVGSAHVVLTPAHSSLQPKFGFCANLSWNGPE